MKKAVLFALCLASCSDERSPEPTSRQADQLNEAEELLDAAAANEKGPEASASGPSASTERLRGRT